MMTAAATPGDAARIAALLADDDPDAAIDAGLMDLDAGADLPHAIIEAQARLRAAWAARDRFRAREARLARRAADRDAKRRAPGTPRPPSTGADAAADTQPAPAPPRPALPDAAAAALARARARAATRRP